MCKDVGHGQNAQVEGDFGVSADLETFWAHWRYNLDDPGCKWCPSPYFDAVLSFQGSALCFLRRGMLHSWCGCFLPDYFDILGMGVSS